MLKFKLGQVVCTRGISEKMKSDPCFEQFIRRSLDAYIDCDWGQLPEEDKKQNDKAVQSGDDRILAAYFYPETGEKVWIVTEWDRSATTILFPEEY